MKVSVSEGDWRCGIKHSFAHCALALALKRQVPAVDHLMVIHRVVLINMKEYSHTEGSLKLIRDFDSDIKPESFPVEVELIEDGKA